ncbi:2-dehydropantoate 2-reductase [Candidimonas humi]|jgi:2-dehydropantoate 2-reductase|uniref:2-dehydropantoate 2-reductase n=1 Tax=Candidimonas humi TaxID=683355 RepID=A0ABV8NXX4_9BURK|nr:2-dehydropantoate 2-reductase [Candidimonas humi]MBV6304852.1 2-dehydropantoate 2-reductase [Candidimonas humi]
MKVCIYGLGAIGGLFAARLAAAGHEVCAVARGHTLQALREHGLREFDKEGRMRSWRIEAQEDPAQLGPQDLVVIAVKTTALAEIAPRVAPLLGPDTAVLSAMNGIPWWFFSGLAGAPAGLRLDSVDPAGAISAAIPASRVLGCVVHVAARVPEPGALLQVAGNGLIVGEPNGDCGTGRVRGVTDALRAAGFDTTLSDCIQRDVWFKLWGNMTMNPVSAITGAPSDRILDDDYVRNFMSQAMREAAAIGARIGLPIEQDPEERHAVTRELGSFRTSMLQDAEAGRMLELDALVAAVIEIGRQVGVPTPWTEALLGIARLQARVRGLYPEDGKRK